MGKWQKLTSPHDDCHDRVDITLTPTSDKKSTVTGLEPREHVSSLN